MSNPNGKKGSVFERLVADWWRDVWDDRVDRRVKTGAKDKGDIANLRIGSRRVVIECKNERSFNLAGWLKEAEEERKNDDAYVSFVVAKRKMHGKPEDQYVIMTQADLLKIMQLIPSNTLPAT